MSNRPQRRQVFDPEVATIIEEQEHKQRRRQMTRAQRRKADRDAKRPRVAYDIPPEVQEAVKQIAEEEQCSISSLVAFFLHDAVQRYEGGELIIEEAYKQPARSLRCAFVIELPAENEKNGN